MNAKLHLLRVEFGEEQARYFGREDFRQKDAYAQHRRHHGDDDRKRLLRLRFFFLRDKARVDRDKSNGGGSARHQVIEPVGYGETGDVGVSRRAGAECVSDIGLAYIANHP